MNYFGRTLNEQVVWREITPAGMISGGGTSKAFQTGDWRSRRPVLDLSKCRQCLLCVPVCPDSSIPAADGKRAGFDYDHCKGCGICVKACPFGALHMESEVD